MLNLLFRENYMKAKYSLLLIPFILLSCSKNKKDTLQDSIVQDIIEKNEIPVELVESKEEVISWLEGANLITPKAAVNDYVEVPVTDLVTEIKLEPEEEVVFARCDSFFLSLIYIPDESYSKDGDYHIQYYLTDNSGNKLLLLSENQYTADIQNPLCTYVALNTDYLIFKKDLNNDNVDEYCFSLGTLNTRFFAVKVVDNVASVILNFAEFAYNPEDASDEANYICFNTGDSGKDIFIDYYPYNSRAVYIYDDVEGVYKNEKYCYEYDMKAQDIVFPCYEKNIGDLTLAFHFKPEDKYVKLPFDRDFIYVKKDQKYYNVFIAGDSISWGWWKLTKTEPEVFLINDNVYCLKLLFENDKKALAHGYIIVNFDENQVFKLHRTMWDDCHFTCENGYYSSVEKIISENGDVSVAVCCYDANNNELEKIYNKITY